ncbi:MAG TPA: hypothetical protein VG738_07190 [Chitinophagaceae bacterium]|nr:hypothetical protein [Chitinophagaceae bacterium]
MSNKATHISSTSHSYNIPLKQKDNARVVDTASLLILLTALIAGLSIAVHLQNVIVIIFSSLFILVILWCLYRVFKGRSLPLIFVVIITITACYFFLQGTGLGMFMGAMLALTFWFYVRLKKRHTVIISGNGVTVQTFFSAVYTWPQLMNVVIKDDLITIDTKRNKLIQKEAGEDLTTEYEAEINEFCGLKLKTTGSAN